MSCTSKIELPYFSVAVENYPMICICCAITGTKEALGNSVRNYPKSHNYAERPGVIRKKRKTLIQADFARKNENK